jgi:hypothetical protein
MSSPTQTAEMYLRLNNSLLTMRGKDADNAVLAMALNNMSMALMNMSVGMRATYSELAEIKRMLAARKS